MDEHVVEIVKLLKVRFSSKRALVEFAQFRASTESDKIPDFFHIPNHRTIDIAGACALNYLGRRSLRLCHKEQVRCREF